MFVDVVQCFDVGSHESGADFLHPTSVGQATALAVQSASSQLKATSQFAEDKHVPSQKSGDVP